MFGSPAVIITTSSSRCQSVCMSIQLSVCLSVCLAFRKILYGLFVQLSSHLQLTFTTQFYTQWGMFRHEQSHTRLLSPPQNGKAVTQGIPQQKSNRCTWRAPDQWEGKRESGRGEESEVGEELKTCWSRKTSFPNILQWFLFHHPGRPHSNPALHIKRAVWAPPFSYHLRTLL